MSPELVHYSTPIFDSARWARFEHRPGDIVISTPPKCGTTWTQMLCALLIFDSPELPEPLGDLSPWLDMLTRSEDDVFDQLRRQTHRRFIKTHTPLDGIPIRDDVTYVVVGRDPRDVAVSQQHHDENLDAEKVAAMVRPQGSPGLASSSPEADSVSYFRRFIESDGPRTLGGMLHHFDTAWQRRDRENVGLFHFADYQRDLPDEMSRLAQLLRIEVPVERLAELAPMAGLDAMRGRADEMVPEGAASPFRDASAFFRTGGSGEWRERATNEDVTRYEERVRDLVEPPLADWAHQGRSPGIN